MANKLKSPSGMEIRPNEAENEKVPKLKRVGRNLSVALNWLSPDDIHELAQKHGITYTQVRNRLLGRTRTKYVFLRDVMEIVERNRTILDKIDELEQEEKRVVA